MAQKPDGKPARTERVTFTRPAAERIAKVVREAERGDRDQGPLTFGARVGGAGGKVFRVATFTGSWQKNTQNKVTFLSVTNTPNTAMATNLFVTLGTAVSSRNCAVAREGTAWYLIAAEC